VTRSINCGVWCLLCARGMGEGVTKSIITPPGLFLHFFSRSTYTQLSDSLHSLRDFDSQSASIYYTRGKFSIHTTFYFVRKLIVIE